MPTLNRNSGLSDSDPPSASGHSYLKFRCVANAQGAEGTSIKTLFGVVRRGVGCKPFRIRWRSVPRRNPV